MLGPGVLIVAAYTLLALALAMDRRPDQGWCLGVRSWLRLCDEFVFVILQLNMKRATWTRIR